MTVNPSFFSRLMASGLYLVFAQSLSAAQDAIEDIAEDPTNPISAQELTQVQAQAQVQVRALSPTYQGEGTFYGATGQGNCSYDPSPSDLMIAAMNHSQYAGSAACGEFVEVTGPKGKVTVRIVDQCPECKPGDIDLSTQAFAKIADPVAGRVPISWFVVPGNVSGPVSFRYKEGSTRWWTAIQVRNHRLPITRLEIKPTGSSTWINVSRTDYNYFVYPTPIPSGPVQVRVTALGGATLQQQLPEPQGGLVVPGTGQFP